MHVGNLKGQTCFGRVQRRDSENIIGRMLRLYPAGDTAKKREGGEFGPHVTLGCTHDVVELMLL